MPFGKYIPSLNIYTGYFWGTVYDFYDNPITPASDYFLGLAEKHNLTDDFQYWLDITTQIEIYSELYIKRHITDPIKHFCYSGFGSIYGDGMVHFVLPEPALHMPNIQLSIANDYYQLKWKYYDK